MAPLSMAVIVIVVFAFLSSIESFKFFGMPRSISNSLPSSVANQQEIVRTAPTIRDLEPIIVDQSRQLRSISDKDFSENILESEGLSVVLFTSSWCGPCRNMQKSLEEIMGKYPKNSKFCSLDTDNNPDSAAEFQVRSIPSTLFFKNGKLVSEIVGSVPKSVVESQILKHTTL